MNLKNAKRHDSRGYGTGYQAQQGVSPGVHHIAAGCLFHDMMKDHGLTGCKDRTCNCPFANNRGDGPSSKHKP